MLTQIGEGDQSQFRAMASCISERVGIKRLLLVVEMARLSGHLDLTSFKTACSMCGISMRGEMAAAAGAGAAM